MLTTPKAAGVLFCACSSRSRLAKSMSKLVSRSLEKRGENSSRSEWRRSLLKLLFGCLCPVSASRLSSTLPCQSLISLCFKTCLLPTCLLLLCRCQFRCLFRPPVVTGSISFLRHVRDRHAADTNSRTLMSLHMLPLHTPPCQALYTAPARPDIVIISNV